MIINFIQGIIKYPSSGSMQQFLSSSGPYVSLRADIGRVDVAFAHGDDNYLLTENTAVPNAWGPLPADTNCWLYWDIDKRTAARTFGFTTVQPVYGVEPPAVPVPDQHWFDTDTGTMHVYTGGAFREVIRVFAAKFVNSVFTPMGYGFPQTPYAGTQVGLSLSNTRVGRIIVDDVGNPVRRPNGHFFTTEHQFFVDGSPVTALRLESTILTGTAQFENLHAYQVVTFSEFGEISHAKYNDIQNSAVAILLEDVNRYDVGTVCVQGHITNPTWNWQTVGAPLWIDDTGTLIEYDPHVISPLLYPVGKSPVARVITQQSVIFDQGLGGKGDTGSGGADVGLATSSNTGVVKLSVEAVDVLSPIAVGDNDPRMTDARTPLSHTHAASAIIPTPYGTLTGANLQLMLQQVEDTKLSLGGGTLTGALTLASNPVSTMQAATKTYVDTAVTSANQYAATAVTNALSSLSIPYDIAFYVPDNPFNPSTTIGGFLVPRSVYVDTTQPTMFIAQCSTAPTAVAGSTLTLFYGSTLMGTVTFAQGSLIGSVVWAAPTVQLSRGDVVTLRTIADVDFTIAGIGITITGCSLAPPCTLPVA